MARVGIVGDPHEPFCHPLYRRFCLDTFAAWRVDKVHFVGDVVDNHAISFHDHDPDGRSSGDEFDLALKGVAGWRRSFPKATVTIGNHDERQYRRGYKDGVSKKFFKSYAEVWETPQWLWEFEHTIDDVLYEHGTGTSGKDAALNLAIQKRTSIVIGHIHAWAGVKWHSNPFSTIFGMNAGCGIDCRAYAMAYGRTFPVRPMLGCGIVIDGSYAYFEPMPCGPKEKYHRSRAGRNKVRR